LPSLASVLPDPATTFGKRVRRRLRDEPVSWFTTVGADGTPQPNPEAFSEDYRVAVRIRVTQIRGF
jgi:hypothetical protein